MKSFTNMKPILIRRGNLILRNYFQKGQEIVFIKNIQNPINGYCLEIVKVIPGGYSGCDDFKSYLEQGYTINGDWLTLDNHNIALGTFWSDPCYMLAHWIKYDPDEKTADLCFIGSRPFGLEDYELEDFMKLAKEGQKFIESLEIETT